MKRREKLATLKFIDSPGMDALHDAMFLPGNTVSFGFLKDDNPANDYRISAAVMSVDLNDSPEERREFLVTGIILRNLRNDPWGGCHYLAYVNIFTRRGTLVILGEPVEEEHSEFLDDDAYVERTIHAHGDFCRKLDIIGDIEIFDGVGHPDPKET